jgi:CheY-like chemotaxis protein
MHNLTTLKSVLVVDDEPEIREIVEAALTLHEQLSVRVCASGFEALQLLEEFVPDLLILDSMMPQLDGPATLLKLRDKPRLAQLPVMFMTADTLGQSVARYLQLGAIGIIAKPFDPMHLAEDVIATWNKAHDG